MIKYLHNYHVHTLYCGHGEGYPKDYCIEAINKGLKTIGFTEHSWLPGSRFDFTIKDHMEEYLDSVNECKKEFNGKLNVYCGLEVDFFPDKIDYYKELLKKYDYLTLSIHYLRYNGENLYGSWNGFTDINLLNEYKDLMISGMKTKLFKFVNHPDNFVSVWDGETINISKEIINTSIELDIPLELNGNQFKRIDKFREGSPRDLFWELAGIMQCKVIINTDAHRIKDLVKDNLPSMFEFAKRHNLNVIEEIKI